MGGTWHVSTPTALCEATLYIDDDGAGDYTLRGDGCGDATGTVKVVNNEMLMEWSVAFCQGRSRYELDRSYRSAAGEAVANTNSLICKGTRASTLKWLGHARVAPGQD